MNYKFKTKPYKHQLTALEKSWNKETYAYFMEMGTGKTKVLIDNMAMLYDKGKIDSVFTLDDGEFEIMQARVLENSELVNKTLENASIPDGIRFGLIVREKQVLVPKKNLEFKINDIVILLSSRKQLKKVEQLFRISEYY